MFSKHDQLQGYDDELLAAMELASAAGRLPPELIAPENYARRRVMQGSGLTNKYAEGYPGSAATAAANTADGRRALAIDRARQLFGAAYANVQPPLVPATNAAVYLARITLATPSPGMSLAHGGHPPRRHKVSSSGKLYNAAQHGLTVRWPG